MLTSLVLISLLNPLISVVITMENHSMTNDYKTGSKQNRSGTNHKISKRAKPKFSAQELVNYHNEVRALEGGSNLMLLKWDDNLAKNAQKWIEKCIFDHPLHYVPNFLGQNLGFSSGSSTYENYKEAAESWYAEKEYYDYNTGSCKKVCAHYTTMVKWDYQLIGCAVHECPILRGFGASFPDAVYIACEYYSPFKEWTDKPYIKGEKCDDCPEGFKSCQLGLCTSRLPYPQWNDSEIPSKMSLARFSAIAIISNIFLVLMST